MDTSPDTIKDVWADSDRLGNKLRGHNNSFEPWNKFCFWKCDNYSCSENISSPTWFQLRETFRSRPFAINFDICTSCFHNDAIMTAEHLFPEEIEYSPGECYFCSNLEESIGHTDSREIIVCDECFYGIDVRSQFDKVDLSLSCSIQQGFQSPCIVPMMPVLERKIPPVPITHLDEMMNILNDMIIYEKTLGSFLEWCPISSWYILPSEDNSGNRVCVLFNCAVGIRFGSIAFMVEDDYGVLMKTWYPSYEKYLDEKREWEKQRTSTDPENFEMFTGTALEKTYIRQSF